jgi:hypothetical protein
MKNQYFGDKNDFFKYDLVLDILQGVPTLNGFTLIRMLTPDDDTNQGRRVNFPQGARRADLFHFFRDHVSLEHRDIGLIQDLFEGKGIPHTLYKPTTYCDFTTRNEYSQGITKQHVARRLVLLDPDVGFETGTHAYLRRKDLEKYLFWDDLQSLVAKSDKQTCVMVYQHLQHDKRRVLADLHDRCGKLATRLKCRSAAYIRDNDAAFLLGSRNNENAQGLFVALARHASANDIEMGIVKAHK